MKQLIILIAVVVVLIGTTTVVQGIFTDRWVPRDSARLRRFTDRVDKIPKVIGLWEGEDDEVDPKEFKRTNCTKCISRRYTNRQTSEKVSLYVVSGTARHITIHTPDWCYQGAGFKMEGKPAQYTMDMGGEVPNPEFATAVFRRPDPVSPAASEGLRIFWAYSDDGQWRGPDWAKVYYAGRPALYKMYLIGPATNTPEESPANAFAKDAFPILSRILFTGEGEGAAAQEGGEVSGPSDDDLTQKRGASPFLAQTR
jgi:hypothetical protein